MKQNAKEYGEDSKFCSICDIAPASCLASTSQRYTGVTTAVASVRPSPPVLVSQTAVGMRKPSGSVLGWQRTVLETFAMPVCYW